MNKEQRAKILGKLKVLAVPSPEAEEYARDYMGMEPEDFEDIAAIFTYENSGWIECRTDGKFWTMYCNTEAYGTLEDCEELMVEYTLDNCPELRPVAEVPFTVEPFILHED